MEEEQTMEEETSPSSSSPLSLKERLISTAGNFFDSYGGEREGNALMDILQNNDCRDILVAATDKDDIACAFTRAAFKNNVNLLHAFASGGLNVDIKDRHCETALMYTARYGHQESAQFLLENNANVDIQTPKGFTALMFASTQRHANVLQLLLDYNANIDLKNKQGRTASDLSLSKSILSLLKNHVPATANNYILK